MAAENYIRDLTEFLEAGNLSDLILTFGDKTWNIHKALACSHSKWFQKAVTIGFEETDSSAITLNDEPEFAHAVDCMVSYFYRAGYNPSNYDMPDAQSDALLHAQVAIIADKYDCASLYELARSSLASSMENVMSDVWIDIAALIYGHTTTELPAHVALRKVVISAVFDQPTLLSTILEQDSAPEIFRSDADLATDLLLTMPKPKPKPKVEDVFEYIFACDGCQFFHAGSRNCSYINPESSSKNMPETCARCRKQSGRISKRHVHKVGMHRSFSCHACGGVHNKDPELESHQTLDLDGWGTSWGNGRY